MQYTVLYPADFFDIKQVDPDYDYEYREAVKFPEFQIVFYNYDDFAAGNPLRLYPAAPAAGLCVYRGWMLQPEKYQELYISLKALGINLINTPAEYEHCHEFPNAYPLLNGFTPKIKVFGLEERINWDQIKLEFKRFMMKDFVKSVKDTDFPAYFTADYTNAQLDSFAARFTELRGELFVKGIVLKEYVDLKRSGQITNEYRVFCLYGEQLSVSKNSNQKSGNPVPVQLLAQLPQLKSNFYTVDLAELDNGEWVVIETGDGQVSGLSPGQYVFKYYEELLYRLQKNNQ